jgi:hypothetical protein
MSETLKCPICYAFVPMVKLPEHYLKKHGITPEMVDEMREKIEPDGVEAAARILRQFTAGEIQDALPFLIVNDAMIIEDQGYGAEAIIASMFALVRIILKEMKK